MAYQGRRTGPLIQPDAVEHVEPRVRRRSDRREAEREGICGWLGGNRNWVDRDRTQFLVRLTLPLFGRQLLRQLTRFAAALAGETCFYASGNFLRLTLAAIWTRLLRRRPVGPQVRLFYLNTARRPPLLDRTAAALSRQTRWHRQGQQQKVAKGMGNE